MKNTTSTVHGAGAQVNCAQMRSPRGLTMGAISLQPGFAPVRRRDLMTALALVGRELGLRPATLVVLDALLTFLPCKDKSGKEVPVTPLHLLTVYAGNDTIAFRAKGLTERQLRRHYDVLEAKGLLQRRDSSNGKRYPIYAGGKITGAYGLDLSPLFAQAAQIIAQAERYREDQRELRGLKSRILGLRQRALEQISDGPALPFLDGLRNLTRRVGLTLIEARAVLAHLEAMLCTENQNSTASVDRAETTDVATKTATQTISTSDEMSGTDGQNVRHNKPAESDPEKKMRARTDLKPQDGEMSWSDYGAISDFWPEAPKDLHEMQQILWSIGQMLRIGEAAMFSSISRLGVTKILELFNQLLCRPESVQNPEAWLIQISRRSTGFV